MVILRVTIKNAVDDKPIPDVKVRATNLNTHAHAERITDDTGLCAFDIAPGTIDFNLSHRDFVPMGTPVQAPVPNVTRYDIPILMKPKGPPAGKVGRFLQPTKKRFAPTTPTGGIGITAFISTYLLEIGIAIVFAGLGFGIWFRHLSGIWGFVLTAAVLIITVVSTRGRGAPRTIGYAAVIFIFFGLASMFINSIKTGDIYQMDWWLSKLNFLRWLGVPTSFIENFKTGVTNVLSYLNIKAIQQPTPQAEKIGGYQALEVKFGSKYTGYSIPTLYANDTSYSLPITISNPNPIDSGLTIRSFSIHSVNSSYKGTSPNQDADMKTKSGLTGKIMCGFSDICNVSNSNLCNIEPQRDEQIIITFKDGAPCTLPPSEHIIDIYDSKECTKTVCLSPPFLAVNGTWRTRGLEGEGCYCKNERKQNNFTELCDDLRFGDQVTVEFSSKFNFSVTGSSEFRILEKEENIKIAPQPKIKTSSGPVDITIYFIPDYVSNEKLRDVKMIVNIANKGGGRADIKEVKLPSITSPVNINFGDCENRIKSITSVNDGEERPAVCDVVFTKTNNIIQIQGPYATIPVSAQINYTYEKIESKTIPITKYQYDSQDPQDSLKAGLPGYCPKS